MQRHVRVCLADGGAVYIALCTVIQFTMRLRMSYIRIVSLRTGVTELLDSMTRPFYMNHSVFVKERRT